MRLSIPAILLPVLLGAASSAWAVCPVIQPTVDTVSPPTGAVGVPLNGVVAFGTSPAFAAYDPAVTLTGGAVVPGALLSGPAGSWIFRPDDDLTASTVYTVSITDADAFGAPANLTFTTGTTSDTVDPVIASTPTLTITGYVDPVRTADCQQPGYWTVHVDWEDAVDASPVIYALDVTVVDLIPDGFAPPPTSHALTAAISERDIAVPGDSGLTVAVFAIDAAGRQGHSPDAVIDTPPAPVGGGASSCSCDLNGSETRTGAAIGATLAIALLAMFATLVRRVFE